MARSVRSFTLSLETQTQLDQLQSDLEPHNLTPLLTAEPSKPLPPPAPVSLTKNKNGLVPWEAMMQSAQAEREAAALESQPTAKMNASRLVDILLIAAINLIREREVRRAALQAAAAKPPKKAS